MKPDTDRTAALDAHALVRRLTRLQRLLARDAGGAEVELYLRAARTIRVSAQGVRAASTTWQGHDEGLALRATSPDGAGLAFAASSGSSAASLRWLLDRHRRPARSLPGAWTWERGGEVLRVDHDGAVLLPAVEELRAWLESARGELAAGESPRPQPLEMAVEVTATVECWVADGGLLASRTRSRAWSLLRLREPWAGDRAGKPVLVARRRFDDLPADGWRAVLEDRRLSGLPEEAPPEGPLPVLFSPECSAVLVAALVRRLHGSASGPPPAIGPAWSVTDDPGRPQALFGGSFDDAGFATRRVQLADGRTILTRIEGAGHLRRPSFRDPPRALASHLVVESCDRGAPEHGVVVTALDLHPAEPERWLLRVEGARLAGGRPAAALRSSSITISPGALAARCVSTVGPPRLSHLGVETPALVLDGLSLRC